jgi:hypothetical protein
LVQVSPTEHHEFRGLQSHGARHGSIKQTIILPYGFFGD